MAKEKYTSLTTPIGSAYFAHLFETEKFDEKDTGKYTVLVKFKESDSDYIKALIQDELDKYLSILNKPVKEDCASLGVKEYKDEEYFKFSMNAQIKLKSGKVLNRTVPLYDAKGNIITNQITEVGNGSKIKVSADLVPFYMNNKNYGVSLRLKGVQIITLEDNQTPSASSLGFGVVEDGLDINKQQQKPLVDDMDDEEVDGYPYEYEVEGDF
jgi:hypothetical protein